MEPRHSPPQDVAWSDQVRCLVVAESSQMGGGPGGDGLKADRPAAACRPEDASEREGERAERRGAVAMFIRQLALLARLENDRKIRASMAEPTPFAFIDLGRKTAQACPATKPHLDDGTVHSRTDLPQAPLGVPLERAVANIVWWLETARQAALTRQTARVTTIEDGDEPAAVGQLAVQVCEPVIGNRVRLRPVEVVGNQAFVEVVRLCVGRVGGNLRAVPGVEEQPHP